MKYGRYHSLLRELLFSGELLWLGLGLAVAEPAMESSGGSTSFFFLPPPSSPFPSLFSPSFFLLSSQKFRRDSRELYCLWGGSWGLSPTRSTAGSAPEG